MRKCNIEIYTIFHTSLVGVYPSRSTRNQIPMSLRHSTYHDCTDYSLYIHADVTFLIQLSKYL